MNRYQKVQSVYIGIGIKHFPLREFIRENSTPSYWEMMVLKLFPIRKCFSKIIFNQQQVTENLISGGGQKIPLSQDIK